MAYCDLVDSIIAYSGQNPNTQNTQNANRAAVAAYLGIVRMHDWSFYKRMFSIPTNTGYSTGTVTYDHTGGATCERQITLTGGSFPTWAAYGYVQIAMKTYQVQKWFSTSVIQLAEFNNPGADITDPQAYQMPRDLYPLPPDYFEAFNAIVQPSGQKLEYVPIAQWAYGRDYYLNQSYPFIFTVTQDLTVPQRQAARFYPAPNGEYSILFSYKADLVKPQYRKVVDGDVTIVSGNSTVNGNGTAFESGMAGTVLRVSKGGNTALPTGIEGDNPPYFEGVIDSVTDGTTLVLQTAPTVSVNRGKYVISSLLDVEPNATREYVFRECQRQYRTMARVPAIAGEAADWQRCLNQAKDADDRYAGYKACSPWRPLLTIFDVPSLPYSTS
jgi:hypothetical protein